MKEKFLTFEMTDSCGSAKVFLQQQLQNMEACFKQGITAKHCIKERSDAVDLVLEKIWLATMGEISYISLIAVGGYGRAELHPYSDIDLLILLKTSETEAEKEKLSAFVTQLWDTGLTIGQSVRTLDECVEEAGKDITIFTNLLEARALIDEGLVLQLQERLEEEECFSPEEFYRAKVEEQDKRHDKFNDTEYHLEPNIKQGPGGLRDLQTIVWVTKHQYGSIKLKSLVSNGFLTEPEFNSLRQCQEKLWDIRMALHFICGRAEERLLFDYQPKLADYFSYQGENVNKKVESFMRDYYLTVRELSVLNDLLLQHFLEKFISKDQAVSKRVNQRFNHINHYLLIKTPDQFQKSPIDLIEIFAVLANSSVIKGIRAQTLRAIRASLGLIDEDFRQNKTHQNKFINLFKTAGLTHTLRAMHRYGVLSAYMPIFKNITGLMQYDLFHTLTVDEHILFVVRNLRRLTVKEQQAEQPFLSDLMAKLANPELLFLAGLFHDITKGQKGGHSQMGAVFAKKFCLQHGLTEEASSQVEFLVAYHLLMSSIIQRQDVYDPETIYKFSQKVKNKETLAMLYLLTVADIKATNITLWNDWKGSLLYQLYSQTALLLEAQYDKISQAQHIVAVQNKAILALSLYPQNKITELWSHLGEDYFIKYNDKEVVWQTQALLDNGSGYLSEKPLVVYSMSSDSGASRLLVFVKDRAQLFANIVAVLERFPIHILEANIFTTDHGWAVDQFYILDNNFEAILDTELLTEIQDSLQLMLIKGITEEPNQVLLTRHEKHFMSAAEVSFTVLAEQTEMLVKASLRPNLLTEVTKVLGLYQLKVQQAKINTVGENAEDLFTLQGKIDQELQSKISQEIQKQLQIDF